MSSSYSTSSRDVNVLDPIMTHHHVTTTTTMSKKNNSYTSFEEEIQSQSSSSVSGKRTMRMRSLQGQTIGNGRKKKGSSGGGGVGSGVGSGLKREEERNFNPSIKTYSYDGHVAPFLEKLFDLISHCDENIACWWEDGESFVVKDPDSFAQEWIPKYFDHNKFQSFSRQLNFYGFKKLPTKAIRVADNDPDMVKMVRFHNDYFKRGRHDLLHHIKRSTRGGKEEEDSEIQQLKEKVQYLESELSELMNVVKIMQKQMMTMGISPPPPNHSSPVPSGGVGVGIGGGRGIKIRNGAHDKIGASSPPPPHVMNPGYLPPPPLQAIAGGGERMTSFLRGFSSEFQASGFIDIMNDPVLSSPTSSRPHAAMKYDQYQSNIQRMQSLGITDEDVLNYRLKGEETLDNLDPIKIDDFTDK